MRESHAHGRTGRPLMWGEPPVDSDSPVDADSAEQATFHLPVGTATFMLTDVEGSTRRARARPGPRGRTGAGLGRGAARVAVRCKVVRGAAGPVRLTRKLTQRIALEIGPQRGIPA